MARSKLRLLLAVAALALQGYDGHRAEAGKGSITVKLPPPRPLAPAPAFTFKPGGKPASKDEHVPSLAD